MKFSNVLKGIAVAMVCVALALSTVASAEEAVVLEPVITITFTADVPLDQLTYGAKITMRVEIENPRDGIVLQWQYKVPGVEPEEWIDARDGNDLTYRFTLSEENENWLWRVEYTVPEIIPEETPEPTEEPTQEPTEEPTQEPTEEPTEEPTHTPTQVSTQEPTHTPTQVPTQEPTHTPTQVPTQEPTHTPTQVPTQEPTHTPTQVPTQEPTQVPTQEPTPQPVPELVVEEEEDDRPLIMLPDIKIPLYHVAFRNWMLRLH